MSDDWTRHWDFAGMDGFGFVYRRRPDAPPPSAEEQQALAFAAEAGRETERESHSAQSGFTT